MKINYGDTNAPIKRGTNILQIDIHPQLERNLPSGIKYFDEAFGGVGTTPSSVNLISGTSGAGKTTMLLQVLDSFSKQRDCITLYNTTEEAVVQVRKTVSRLKLKNGFNVGQDCLLPEVFEHLDSLRREHPGKDIIFGVDSLQSHDDGKYPGGITNSMTPVRIAENVASYCKQNFSISFLIGQVTKNGQLAGKQTIKHIVDSHLHLFIDLKPTSETFGSRILRMEKSRFGPSGIGFVLGLDKERGLYEKGSWDGESDS